MKAGEVFADQKSHNVRGANLAGATLWPYSVTAFCLE